MTEHASARVDELESVALRYHMSGDVPDKFIEDACQHHCCDWLESLIQPGASVIELGFGEGVTLSRLHALPAEYTVVEGAPTLASEVRRRWPAVGVAEGLFEEYTPPAPVDMVLALHVFEHVDDPVLLAEHLRGWLKPDGELVVVVPNKRSLHRRLGVAMGLQPALDTLSARDEMVGHQRVYDFEQLEADMRAGGFEPLVRRGFFLKTLSNAQMLSYPVQLIEGLNLLGDEVDPDLTANIALRCRVAGSGHVADPSGEAVGWPGVMPIEQ